jgi:HEAT repeat protein
MQDGAAAPALVEALSDASLRPSIYTALRSIGPTGEPGVLKMLQHQEVEIRAEGCRILAEIGTTKCVDELRRLAKSTDAADEPVKTAAKAALTALGKSETAPAPVTKPATTDDKNPFEPGASEEDPFKPSPPTDPKSEENPFEPKKKP